MIITLAGTGGEEVVEGEDPSVVVYLRRDGH